MLNPARIWAIVNIVAVDTRRSIRCLHRHQPITIVMAVDKVAITKADTLGNLKIKNGTNKVQVVIPMEEVINKVVTMVRAMEVVMIVAVAMKEVMMGIIRVEESVAGAIMEAVIVVVLAMAVTEAAAAILEVETVAGMVEVIVQTTSVEMGEIETVDMVAEAGGVVLTKEAAEAVDMPTVVAVVVVVVIW